MNRSTREHGGRLACAVVGACALLGAVVPNVAVASAPPEPSGDDPVLEWNGVMQEIVTTVPDPFLQGRTATMMHLAQFEAVNAIVGGYEPFFGTVSAPPGASPEAAAIAAAHRVLVALHPDQAADLDARRVDSLAAVADGPAEDDGIAVGETAAQAVLDARADDGSDADTTPYTPGTEPGDHQPTPPDFAPVFRPGLGQVPAFVIDSGEQFRADPPPALDSERYAVAFAEVSAVGEAESADRPVDRADVARFFAFSEEAKTFYEPARQASRAQGTSLVENARVFALIGLAVFDTSVANFESKYHYDFWRPVTAIRAAETDGNPDTTADSGWGSFIPTPPFPSYPGGAAAFATAARVVFEDAFGPDGHDITLASGLVPDVELQYTNWDQLTADLDDARIFGGVHWRFDQEEGARQGERVAQYVLENALRPVDDG